MTLNEIFANFFSLKNGDLFKIKGITGYDDLSTIYKYENKKYYEMDCFCSYDELNLLDIMYNNDDIEIFKIKKVIKLSKDEIAILRNLPKEYKYIVRTDEGTLRIFTYKPIRNSDNEDWYKSDFYKETSCELPYKCLFSFIELDDAKPYLISDLLKNNENTLEFGEL